MTLPDIPKPASSSSIPPLAFRFEVVFLPKGGETNEIDIIFQRVSGLGQSVVTTPLAEGGQNSYTQQLPTKVQHENLVLERGMFIKSPLGAEIIESIDLFKFKLSNVLIILLDHANEPLIGWQLYNAFPVKWSLSTLDATQNSVVIETMTLAYQRIEVKQV